MAIKKKKIKLIPQKVFGLKLKMAIGDRRKTIPLWNYRYNVTKMVIYNVTKGVISGTHKNSIVPIITKVIFLIRSFSKLDILIK